MRVNGNDLLKLAPNDRQAYLAVSILNMPLAKAAERFGAPAEVIRKRAQRARRMLAAYAKRAA